MPATNPSDESARTARPPGREHDAAGGEFAGQFCLALTGAEELEPLLEIATVKLADRFGVAAGVWIVEPATNRLELRASARRGWSKGNKPACEISQFASAAAIEQIARERQPWTTNAASECSLLGEPEHVRRQGVAAFAGFPLMTRHELHGVLAVFAAQPLADDTVAALRAATANLGLAVHARLTAERLRQANQELERVATERSGALEESERRHRTLLANLPGMAYRVRVERSWPADYVSEGSQALLGVAPEVFTSGRIHFGDLIHPDDAERVWNEVQVALNQRKPFGIEYRARHANGDWRWVSEHGRGIDDAQGNIAYIEGFVTDITARKRGEGQTLRTQRLESLGTLAGGVAHDLNNALAPILMGLELLRAQTPVSDQLVNTMMASARRGADMVRQLLMFARGAEGARRLIQPRHVLQEMEQIVRGTFPKDIAVEVEYGKNVQGVLADPTQLHQVLLNLCVNARDAMPGGGNLRLAVENVSIDPAFASSLPDAQPGHYVAWRVSDTGSGIEPEIVERIFEPFFTTKGPEKGTGLGLSTVLGIVRAHGGFVRVESTPGKGSTFSVYLPATNNAEPETSLSEAAALRGNGEGVLIVDDDPAVRHVSQSVLTALNFRVIVARDGTEALLRAAAHQDEVKVVITDLHMPHMDGLTFVRVIKRLLPRAGIIVASGRLDEQTEKQFAALGVRAILHKPFTQDRLVNALRAALGESGTDVPPVNGRS